MGYFNKRKQAFKVAGLGLCRMFISEAHAKIHFIAAVAAIALAVFLRCSALEWCLIILCIGIVISAEAVNTAVEKLSDRITTERDPLIGAAKDIAAGAVLIVAAAALAVGLIIFLPKILDSSLFLFF